MGIFFVFFVIFLSGTVSFKIFSTRNTSMCGMCNVWISPGGGAFSFNIAFTPGHLTEVYYLHPENLLVGEGVILGVGCGIWEHVHCWN